MNTQKYWIAVASREHVKRGIEGSFAQSCHGKCAPLKKMKPGDYLLYYSPTSVLGDPDKLQKFTAIGKIREGEPYQVELREDFKPFRIDVDWIQKFKEAEVRPLLQQLDFVKANTKDLKHWGWAFHRGYFEIKKKDFLLISKHMGVVIEKEPDEKESDN
jgi:hypothetical protein